MKKVFLFGLMLLLSATVAMASDNNKVTFIQATDIHVMHPDLMKNRGKSFLQDIGYNCTLHEESYGVFKALLDSVKAIHPDIFLISGDIAKDGEYIGHELVAQHLKELTDEGIKVYVIPGNHDVNNPFGRIYDGDQCTYARTTTLEEFAEIYADYGFNQAVSRDDHSLSYMVYPNDKLAVLCIDANDFTKSIYNPDGVPDNMKDTLTCRSHIGEETLQWIEQQAKKACDEGRYIIMQEHYPLIKHFNFYSAVAAENITNNGSEDKDLNNETLCNRLSNAGIKVSFSGHVHAGDINYMTCENNQKLWDINSNSTVYGYPTFRMFTVDTDNGDLNLTTRVIDNYKVGDVSLIEYSKNYIETSEFRQSYIDDTRRYYYALMSLVEPYKFAIEQSALKLPKDADELALWADTTNVADDILKLLFYHALGNEHQKDYTDFLTGMQQDFDKIVWNICDHNKAIRSNISILIPLLLNRTDFTLDNVVDVFIKPEMQNIGLYHDEIVDDFTANFNIANTSLAGITTMRNDDAAERGDGQIYNMQGQRVTTVTKGLYIINGKKVIIK